MILGISGKLGVGKSYLAENVIQSWFNDKFPKSRSIVLEFADQLKIDCIVQNGLSRKSVFETKDVETRKTLIHQGMGHRAIDEDYYIKYMEEWIAIHYSRGIRFFIIVGVRFENELKWIEKQQGGYVFRVLAPGRNRNATKDQFIESNQSEIDLDSKLFPLVVNNDVGEENKAIKQINEYLTTIKFYLKIS